MQDTGVGIPEAQRSRIFQHFTQADSSTTRKHGGTGLGLAICSQLVGLMGGRIEVDSEVGRGSTFKVTLRLPTAHNERAVKDELPASPSHPAELLGRRILLAEDNPVNQLVARSLLARLGCEVEVASSGEEALRMLEGGRLRPGPHGLHDARDWTATKRPPKFVAERGGRRPHAHRGDDGERDAGRSRALPGCRAWTTT